MSLSCYVSLALLAGSASGARISKKKGGAKFIAGVPVLNCDWPCFGELGAEQEWNVMLKPEAKDSQIQEMCALSANGCNIVGHPEKGGVPFFEMRGTEQDLAAVIKAGGDLVKFVEPDTTAHAVPELRAEIEAGNAEAPTWGLRRIGVPYRSVTGVGSTVFILDTGVRVTHQDFGGRAVPALDMSVGGVECNGDLTCAPDRQGHGTHCAGTAAGTVYGVAPGANIRSIKVLSDQGSGSWSWSYGALDWLATSGVTSAVASMSLGGSGTQQAMKDAVDAAVAAGVTVTVASGNSNSDACRFSPAFVPAAITVGSMNEKDEASTFSNYGRCVNIWAPGSNVESTSHASDTATRILTGTSMACPHVAGAAALGYEKGFSEPYDWMTQNGLWNVLSGLTPEDTNLLLYVGEQ